LVFSQTFLSELLETSCEVGFARCKLSIMRKKSQ